MRKCIKCENKIEFDDNFCSSCGTLNELSKEEIEKNQRYKNIINNLSFLGIGEYKGLKQLDECWFKIEVEWPGEDDNAEVFFKFEANEMFIRITTKYICGYLDLKEDVDAEDILRLLMENVDSFLGSSSYLGINPFDDYFLVYLNSYHHFLAKWTDEDIAKALSLVLFDIRMSMILHRYPKPIKLWM